MRATLTVAALLALPSLGAATVNESHFKPIKAECTAKTFRAFSQQTWALSKWKRGMPSGKTLAAQRHRLACAGPENRKAMKARWRKDREAYFQHRREEFWRERITPFPGGGNWWAIPYCSVIAESGGDYYIGYAGAYGLITPTWQSYGGGEYAGNAGEAAPGEQDLVAHRVYVDNGSAAWTPFEGGQC